MIITNFNKVKEPRFRNWYLNHRGHPEALEYIKGGYECLMCESGSPPVEKIEPTTIETLKNDP